MVAPLYNGKSFGAKSFELRLIEMASKDCYFSPLQSDKWSEIGGAWSETGKSDRSVITEWDNIETDIVFSNGGRGRGALKFLL